MDMDAMNLSPVQPELQSSDVAARTQPVRDAGAARAVGAPGSESETPRVETPEEAARRDSVELSDRLARARELALKYLRDVIDPDPIDGNWKPEPPAAVKQAEAHGVVPVSRREGGGAPGALDLMA